MMPTSERDRRLRGALNEWDDLLVLLSALDTTHKLFNRLRLLTLQATAGRGVNASYVVLQRIAWHVSLQIGGDEVGAGEVEAGAEESWTAAATALADDVRAALERLNDERFDEVMRKVAGRIPQLHMKGEDEA